MNTNLEAVSKYASNWKSILGLCTLLYMGTIFILNTQYVTKAEAAEYESRQIEDRKKAEIRQIRREIRDLEVQKTHEHDAQKLKVLQARIRIKENDIKEVLGE